MCQTSTRLCHSNEFGHRSRVSDCSSVITAVSATKTNGRTKKSVQAIANECTATHCSLTRIAGVTSHRPGTRCRVRMSTAAKAMLSANSTSAITHAAPMSNRWKPRL